MPRLALLASLGLAASAAAAEGRRPVIISTDPGVDDTIAILLAASSPDFDLRAVMVNFGSLHNLTQLAHNALGILTMIGRDDVPVYVGAGDPISDEFHDLGGELFHGTDGLGGVPLPKAVTRGPNTTLTAAEAIVEACRTWSPPPVLISLAPITNIALALDLEPRLPLLCPDLYLMGGAVAVAGNVSPIAEANLANDAEAAQRVFAAGFDLRAAPLDVTMATWLDTPYLETLRELPNVVGPFIWNITRFYTNAYKVHGGFPDGMPLHDPSAVMMLLHPEIYDLQQWPASVDVAAYPGATRGLLVADRRGGPLSPPPPGSSPRIAMGVRADLMRTILRDQLASLPLHREVAPQVVVL